MFIDSPRAQELAESWINGNRSTVLAELNGEKPKIAAYLAAAIALCLDEDHREWFLDRLLKAAEREEVQS